MTVTLANSSVHTHTYRHTKRKHPHSINIRRLLKAASRPAFVILGHVCRLKWSVGGLQLQLLLNGCTIYCIMIFTANFNSSDEDRGLQKYIFINKLAAL